MFKGRLRLSKMPSYYSLTTPNYVIHVEPIGIRSYLRFLPYLSGGFLMFDLYAYDRNARQMPLEYEWRILRMHENKYSTFDDKEGKGIFSEYVKDRDLTLWSRLIIAQVSASGQYGLQLRVIDEMDWTNIADFEQLSRDRVTFNVMIAAFGIVTAIIGGIVGWVLKG